jgi:hypothetical protein
MLHQNSRIDCNAENYVSSSCEVHSLQEAQRTCDYNPKCAAFSWSGPLGVQKGGDAYPHCLWMCDIIPPLYKSVFNGWIVGMKVEKGVPTPQPTAVPTQPGFHYTPAPTPEKVQLSKLVSEVEIEGYTQQSFHPLQYEQIRNSLAATLMLSERHIQIQKTAAGPPWKAAKNLRAGAPAFDPAGPKTADLLKSIIVTFQVVSTRAPLVAHAASKLASATFATEFAQNLEMYGMHSTKDSIAVNLQTSVTKVVVLAAGSEYVQSAELAGHAVTPYLGAAAIQPVAKPTSAPTVPPTRGVQAAAGGAGGGASSSAAQQSGTGGRSSSVSSSSVSSSSVSNAGKGGGKGGASGGSSSGSGMVLVGGVLVAFVLLLGFAYQQSSGGGDAPDKGSAEESVPLAMAKTKDTSSKATVAPVASSAGPEAGADSDDSTDDSDEDD